MPALALVDVLPDFGAPPRAHVRPGVEASETAPAEPQQPETPETAEAERITEAVALAEAAVAERLEAAHAATLAEIENRHAEELRRLQAEFGEQAGLLIAERLAELEQRVVGLTSSVVARILSVALSESVKQGALEELSRSIVAAIGDREAVRVRVRGPVSLYEALKPGLGRHAEQVEFSENGGFDLTVSVDDTLFETRMAEWSAALSGVFA